MTGFRRVPFWKREGLCFECTRCGACCRQLGTVRVEAVEAAAIAARLHGPTVAPESLVGELWMRLPDGAFEIEVVDEQRGCPLLVDGMCSVNDIKPQQCATFPFWPEVVRNERTWKREGRLCEGIGRGPRYSPEEIDRVLGEAAVTRGARSRGSQGTDD